MTTYHSGVFMRLMFLGMLVLLFAVTPLHAMTHDTAANATHIMPGMNAAMDVTAKSSMHDPADPDANMTGSSPIPMQHENHGSMPHDSAEGTMVPDGSAPDLGGHVHKEPAKNDSTAAMAFVDEKLGSIIPEGIMFRDESGQMVDIRSLMDKPTLIAPVYFTCPNVCNILQSSIARVLPQMAMHPVSEYRVLSVSFDEMDTPELAAHRKNNYIAAMHNNFPPDGWRFLTGSKESVDTFMNAIGYHFTRAGKDFIHPIVIVIASPDGKIVRYLYGNNFLPFDTAMALTEAAQGKVGLSLKRMVSYCFAYDPQGKRYVLDIMRIAGFVVLFGVVVLFLILSRGGRKLRK